MRKIYGSTLSKCAANSLELGLRCWVVINVVYMGFEMGEKGHLQKVHAGLEFVSIFREKPFAAASATTTTV